MKKSLIVVLFIGISFTVNSTVVCYPGMGGGGSWDCFWSNGSCGGTWSTCGCSGCSGSGGSGGCNSCCCYAAVAFSGTNGPSYVIAVNAEGQMSLTTPTGKPKALGNISQLSLASKEVCQFTVNESLWLVTFAIYDGEILKSQVQESGAITNKEAAFVRNTTLSY
jgi:hypothetical protein